ncbi:TetR/AcrR family transcriptional regulator [Micromonospora peucetia]|uniref:Transcriptional regulator, TetR family n=1 Tax=Micromonospora peucetia TaxID=47871 RepID=A0A1C6V4A1_9ACTN|nr:TetR/AcrR family transcriptional regulator [Micromonospora peucetia]MCX4389151.1 TetR/AcrR family transcriptional regulator [Micromonospora peucetia]SCL61171.1 transcriptional regulator, TetR family [Micromonospora peucetia]
MSQVRGPRGAEAIHAAVLDLLAADGYAALTVEGVARRSGVNKTTLYRWWPSKPALVAATFRHAIARELPVPDTGTLRGDLAALLRSKTAFFAEGPGRLAADVLAHTGADAELARLADELLGQHRTHVAEVTGRARARGELTGPVDDTLLADLLLGPVWLRAVVTHRPLPPADADALVDTLLAGLPAHRAQSPGRPAPRRS